MQKRQKHQLTCRIDNARRFASVCVDWCATCVCEFLHWEKCLKI